jgi:hypothetical protein
MVGALHRETSDLAGRSAASKARAHADFAADTRSAIENGCELALAALVERPVQRNWHTGSAERRGSCLRAARRTACVPGSRSHRTTSPTSCCADLR